MNYAVHEFYTKDELFYKDADEKKWPKPFSLFTFNY